MGSTGFAFSIGDELATSFGTSDPIPLCDCGFSEPTLIWLLPGQTVPCGICNCPRTMWRGCNCFPNLDSDGVVAVMSVWCFTTAGKINSAFLSFISLSRQLSAAFRHPGLVSFWTLICLYSTDSRRCSTVVAIVPFTQPGWPLLLNMPSSVSS